MLEKEIRGFADSVLEDIRIFLTEVQVMTMIENPDPTPEKPDKMIPQYDPLYDAEEVERLVKEFETAVMDGKSVIDYLLTLSGKIKELADPSSREMMNADDAYEYQILSFPQLYKVLNLKGLTLDSTVYDSIPIDKMKEMKFIPINMGASVFSDEDRNDPINVGIKLNVDTKTFMGWDFTCQRDIDTIVRRFPDAQFILCQRPLFERFEREQVSGAEIDRLTSNITVVNTNIEAVSVDADSTIQMQLLKNILQDAFLRGTSDIHFDPIGSEFVVRYRIDGDLVRIKSYEMGYSTILYNMIKETAQVSVKTPFEPVKGQIQFKLMTSDGIEKPINMRINMLRVNDAYSLNIRFVSDKLLDLKACLTEETYKTVLRVSQMSKGLVLVVGPTGSGKSTLIYQILREIAATERCVLTAEDPVEMYIPGVTHINIDAKGGVTWDDILASFLRHDPDVVLAGEIRHLEIAQKAISMAETGHLVFSTLHTNDAISSVNRLKYMGVEAQTIADSVKVVISQRLIKRLCSCKKPYYLPEDSKMREMFGLGSGPILLYRPVGCKLCGGSGYKGRVSINEVLQTNKTFRAMVLAGKSTDEIKEAMRKDGFKTMIDDGIEKARAGLTTLDQLVKYRLDED